MRRRMDDKGDYIGRADLDDWGAGAALAALGLLLGGLLWWPLVLYSWHWWVG